MALVADCPDDATLRKLLLGNLPDEQMELLGAHLLRCQSCAVRAGTLEAADALTISLRDAATLSAGQEDTLVQELRQRLHHLHVVQTADAEPTQTLSAPTEASVKSSAPTPSAPAPSFSFLAPAQAPDEIGRLGAYRILKVLGQGGMGVVFQAEDPRLGRLCALKVMLPEVANKPGMKERFLREARAAAQIEHDHIIPIYQVDEDRGVPYISMPFLKGMSLEDWLRKKHKEGPHAVKVAEILKVGRQIARGLAAAHERGLIHRDIKPANIWLDASAGGRVKILDFGLARLLESAGEQNLTQSGAILGTPSYMAPEQARGDKLHGRADLFSLGVVLYRLCTGVLPFKGKDTLSTLLALATHDPPAPHTVNSVIPQPLSELVMKLLAKEPNERTTSAQDVVAEIQILERGLVSPAELATVKESPLSQGLPVIRTSDPEQSVAARLKPHRRISQRTSLAVAATGGLVLVFAAIVLFWQTPEGLVRFEINDPQIKVVLDKTGSTITGAGERSIRLKPGKHGLTITRGEFTFDTTRFELRKGDDTRLRIDWLQGNQIQVMQDGKLIGSQVFSKRETSTSAPRFALQFDGRQSLVSIPSLERNKAVPYTLEGWIRNAGKGTELLIKLNGKAHCQLFVHTGALMAMESDSKNETRRLAIAALPADRSQWTHVAYVLDEKESRLFVDGKLTAQVAGEFPDLSEPARQQGASIGAEFPQRFSFFSGEMREVRISTTAR